VIVVIQCAATKRPGVGHLQSRDGRRVVFVADPLSAPAIDGIVYARPDDQAWGRMSWRDVLLRYNERRDNPLGLSPAGRLYENKIYARLVDRFGPWRVYILSAGWGLISAGFLTPYYDITFSQSADAYKRRRQTDRYLDFQMLPCQTHEPVVFFGGKDYLPLFCALTASIRTTRTAFYNSAKIPQADGCVLQRFDTTTRTNWHYECANAFLDGEISPVMP